MQSVTGKLNNRNRKRNKRKEKTHCVTGPVLQYPAQPEPGSFHLPPSPLHRVDSELVRAPMELVDASIHRDGSVPAADKINASDRGAAWTPRSQIPLLSPSSSAILDEPERHRRHRPRPSRSHRAPRAAPPCPSAPPWTPLLRLLPTRWSRSPCIELHRLVFFLCTVRSPSTIPATSSPPRAH